MWFKKERWRGTLGMELSLKSLCVANVIEVEKEIVWHTFLKLLSSRNEKKILSYVWYIFPWVTITCYFASKIGNYQDYEIQRK